MRNDEGSGNPALLPEAWVDEGQWEWMGPALVAVAADTPIPPSHEALPRIVGTRLWGQYVRALQEGRREGSVEELRSRWGIMRGGGGEG
jgi:hypothetical protein